MNERSPRTLLLGHNTQAKTKCCHQARTIGSKGAVLVIVWTSLVYGSLLSCSTFSSNSTPGSIPWEVVVGIISTALIGPLAGFFASIYLGRYRALHTGLWLMWAGNVITVAVLIIQWFFPSSKQVLSYSGFWVATSGYYVGFTLYVVNAIPFGLDQMPDASGEQISAFIHWNTWSISCPAAMALLGYAAINCTGLDGSDFSLPGPLLTATLLTVALCSNCLLHGWLIIEPKGKNPLRTFCGVLRFAAKHKIPVRRSAFTFWEEEKPSRIDLAKSKYGGPFTGEEVEEVKTCLRMSVVIASISVTMSTFCACLLSLYEMLGAEFITTDVKVCPRTLAYTLGYLSSMVFGLPLYEVLIHPLIKKWIPRTLRRVGLSLTLGTVVSLLLLLSTTVWYMYTNPALCMFASKGSSHFQVDLNWVEIPTIIVTYTMVFLLHTAMLEFVCAQAPYILRGLLVGLVYSIVLSSAVLGLAVYTVWKIVYKQKAPNSPSCGVWFYLFTTITATLGCVLWCAVAKWYKRRERDEPDMCRIFAENYYDH